jgi:hypothetical protein
VPSNKRRQRRGAILPGRSRRDRFDAGETDLAAILEAKAARVGHGGDASFALRREGACRSDERRGDQRAGERNARATGANAETA